ncbi:hypothetical protein [Sinorhizobium meliloti]|uniref:hypothetical protein n=1 Tax=Rhizobium meliloti TaxID=382 RepID=UPI000FD71E34|nr:hypothetical protein [Sinorhizobium meliloti]RVQ04168.1 hypothetical protein CN070_03035 [Sinorhizobium meliloti]
MPRTGGVYSPPAGTKGVSNTTIQSVPYNAFVDDLTADANAARPVTAGGTGSTTASGARTALGLAIGTNVQAFDAGLQSIAGLTTAADRMIYTTASDVYATTALTPFARTLLDDTTAGAALTTLGVSAFVQSILNDADAAAVRTTIGLGTMATQNAASVAITGGSIAGITDLAIADGGTGASDAATARANLGANNASNLTTGTVPDARITGAYSGITNLTMTGVLEIANGSPYLRFRDTTTSAYDARIRLDANNVYFDSSSDGTTYAEFMRFEADTKAAYFQNTVNITSGGEALRLIGSSTTTDPYISFYQSTTRGAYIQYIDGTTAEQGLKLFNDLATGGDTQLVLKNTGGVDGLGYTVNGTDYTVWHSGNLTLGDLGGVPTTRQVIAGNGLTGGGALSANVTVTMGTPGSITNSTGNSVTSTSHVHALGFTAAEVYLGTNASEVNYPIGTVLFVALGGGRPDNNTTATVRLSGTNGFSIEGTGTALSGTWRARGGYTSDGDRFGIYQKVA